MQLLGQPVRHNAFGTGVITGLSGNIITIDFAQGEKRFISGRIFPLSDPEGRRKAK